MGSTTLDIGRLRAETPGCAERIHFNNAGAALMPAPVLEAMVEHLTAEAEIGGYEAADAKADAIADFYDAAGELLGCRPENVAFATSATDALLPCALVGPVRARRHDPHDARRLHLEPDRLPFSA